MKEKKATQVNGCKQCKRGLNTTQKFLIIVSAYILITSIYGTIKLISELYHYFQ